MIISFPKELTPPVFKKKHSQQSYTTNFTNNNIVLYEKGIKLPKLGFVKCKYHKNLEGIKIINVTVKRLKCGYYEASIIYECEQIYLSKTSKSVGIDLGVRKLITTSDNVKYISDLDLDRINKKLKINHRRLSKCKLHSNNWEKQRKRLARIYKYKDDFTLDSIHKAMKAIVTEYDTIYMEDLDVKDLLSKQKLKKPKQKLISSCLGKIRVILECKSEYYGKTLVKIDRYYASSQTCSRCGKKHNVKANEIFHCPHCNLIIDRDYNAAKNILNYGLSH